MNERYFQYLTTENRGKVTSLDYIDDMSLPDNELFVFKDGFKCYANLVAPFDMKDAFEAGGYVMAEVPNAFNVWKFEETKIEPEVKKGVTDSGEKVIAADPYFTKMGENGMAEELHKPTIKVKATPPKRMPNFDGSLNNLDEFRISVQVQFNNKAETEITEAVEENKETVVSETHISETEQTKETEIEKPAEGVGVYKPDSTYFEMCRVAVPDDTEYVVLFGEKHDQEFWQGFMKWCVGRYEEYLKQKEIEENQEKVEEYKITPDLNNLVDTCKTKNTEIDITVNMNLPVPEFFKLVEMSYGADSVREVLKLIVDKMSVDSIKTSILNYLEQLFSSDMNSPVRKSLPQNTSTL